jgi:hypothetical protein
MYTGAACCAALVSAIVMASRQIGEVVIAK